MNNNLTPAATVLVLRDSEEGMEVLMVKRSKKPPFENLYVFPGGKIDEGDCSKDLESYCDGHNDQEASLRCHRRGECLLSARLHRRCRRGVSALYGEGRGRRGGFHHRWRRVRPAARIAAHHR